VQLLVKTPLFVVVLAMDVRYVTRALERVYKEILLRNGSPSGLDYIEKIIQLPYTVRPVSPAAIERYLQGQMDVEAEAAATPDPDLQPAPGPGPDGGNGSSSGRSTSEPTLVPAVLRFTAEELGWVRLACRQLDLSPRAMKRIVNAYKLLKIVWFRPNRYQRPDAKVQQARASSSPARSRSSPSSATIRRTNCPRHQMWCDATIRRGSGAGRRGVTAAAPATARRRRSRSLGPRRWRGGPRSGCRCRSRRR